MKKITYKTQVEDALQDFREHKASFSEFSNGKDKIFHLSWKAPKTRINSVNYYIVNNVLFIEGDLFEGVFSWSQDISWEFLADCRIDYFSSKCRASETGVHPFSYCEATCREEIQRRITDMEKESDEGFQERWASLKEDLNFYDQNQFGFSLEQNWDAVCDLFGHDCYEWIFDCGKISNHYLVHWLVGIQEALKQKEKQV
jgi:hypothetical protein